ncbi:STAS domain-containing protein [Mycobacterium sp. E740]|uniref:STAS domain-containing protein n=1 Tax=Mycobacterium sp. E740 TaxID=1834149 RepID=UPI0007FDD56E|nr:STAS domain-containing protein [Mycobacterium sp. E740]OBI76229.1 hypothetical protein A5663_03435 [Mycobacterium sp. E740]
MSVAPIHSLPSSLPKRQLSVTTSAWAGGRTGRITVSVSGEVDAANAKEFATAVGEAVSDARRVLLDLSGLEFFAFDGIAALHALNARLARSGTSWSVLPSAAVARVLTLCDPEQLIPRALLSEPTRLGRASLRLVGQP